MTTPRLTWVRAGDRDPDLKGEEEHFIALDREEEVGVVKFVVSGVDASWMWSMGLTHPGPAFKRPTSGYAKTRGQAARELGACWSAFRGWYEIED